MNKSLVLALTFTLSTCGTVLAANPFSDVPSNSWAYAAVEKLANQGVVEGMGNGKFEGNRNMTRYEMAQIVAKAMARGIQSSELKKLATEFAQELQAMGIRVGKVEEKVQISGEFRLRYRGVSKAGSITPNSDDFQLRTRLHLNGRINKNWTAYMMLENIQNLATNTSGTDEKESTVYMRRAVATGKYNKLQTQLGRMAYSDKDGMLFNPAELDGVIFNYNFGDVKATALYGRFAPFKFAGFTKERVDSLGVALDWQASKNLEFNAAFYNHRNRGIYGVDSQTANVYDLLATYKVKDWKFSAMYIGTSNKIVDTAAKDGYAFRIAYGNFKPANKGSYLVQANYVKIPVAAYYGSPYQLEDLTESKLGAQGWLVAADYVIEKNVRLHISYADVKDVTSLGNNTRVYTGYVRFYF